MAENEPDPIIITKLEAARRQIETAIELWFREGDPVSIRTLTAAGHQVCNAILKERGIHASMVFNFDLMSPEHRAGYKKFMLAPENFFKHAQHDADPTAEIELITSVTDCYLADAICLYHKLSGGIVTMTMRAFSVYFEMLYPHLTQDDSPTKLPEFEVIKMRSIPKPLYLDAFLKAAELLGRK